MRLGAEGVEVGGLGEGFLPGGGVEDAFFKEVVGEKLTGHWIQLVEVASRAHIGSKTLKNGQESVAP